MNKGLGHQRKQTNGNPTSSFIQEMEITTVTGECHTIIIMSWQGWSNGHSQLLLTGLKNQKAVRSSSSTPKHLPRR